MTIAEKKEKLRRKREELNQYISINNDNRYPYLLFSWILLDILFLGLLILNIMNFQNLFFNIVLIALLIIVNNLMIVVTIVFFVKKKKAPYAIEKLSEEISILENEINELKNPVKSNSKDISNLDVLLKYKELLDKNVITKEEFDAKKKEILG